MLYRQSKSNIMKYNTFGIDNEKNDDETSSSGINLDDSHDILEVIYLDKKMMIVI